MADPVVLYEVKDQIGYITLNRPQKLNAVNPELCIELSKTWLKFEQDPEARIAIFSGAGKGFSAGADLNVGSELTQYLYLAYPPNGIKVFKPIISAVHGFAAGVSFGLAIRGADFTIVAEGTRLMFPEPKIGIVGSLMEYQPYMPFKVSLEFYMTGEDMDLKRAFDLGLVNKIVPESELMDEARNLAKLLINRAPLTLRAIKYAHYKHMETTANQARREFEDYIQVQKDSDDIDEGVRAFFENRDPVFKGR
jgi:enoyl-CoA hydratase/carnithine racemase